MLPRYSTCMNTFWAQEIEFKLGMYGLKLEYPLLSLEQSSETKVPDSRPDPIRVNDSDVSTRTIFSTSPGLGWVKIRLLDSTVGIQTHSDVAD